MAEPARRRATYADREDEMVSVAPFDAISLPLNDLFPFDTPPSPEA